MGVKDKKILIIGNGNPIIIHDKFKEDLLIVDNDKILVNGEYWEPIEISKPSKFDIPIEYYHTDYTRVLDKDIDLISEYELVMTKKSKLSKWDRNEVVRLFETKYRRSL